MSSENFLISIGIATKNRQKYAEAAVRQILTLDRRIQIVVSDNSDEEYLYDMIKDVIDGNRVKYYYTDVPITVVKNYSVTAENSDGYFFCAIGDDDGILPGIIELSEWMRENGVDAVKPNRKLSYIWPNEENSGTICVDMITKASYKMDTRSAIVELLRYGGQGYYDFDLIGSYHCIVTMKMMNEVKRITGYYYDGASPDIYSAVCLSSLEGFTCVSIDYPFTLPGVCPRSTTFDGKKGQDVGNVSSAPHFAGKNDYQWDDRIPYFYTSSTIWAETMMHALKDIGKSEFIDQYYDEKELINRMYWNNLKHSNEIVGALSDSQKTKIDESYRNSAGRIKRIKRILKVGGYWIVGNYYRKHNIPDIQNAVDITTSYLKKRPLNFSRISIC